MNQDGWSHIINYTVKNIIEKKITLFDQKSSRNSLEISQTILKNSLTLK
jgi:hypothetical protein